MMFSFGPGNDSSKITELKRNPGMRKILMLNIFGMERSNAELIHFSCLANGFISLGYDVTVVHVSAKGRTTHRDILSNDVKFKEIVVRGRWYTLFITSTMAISRFLKIIKDLKPEILYVRLSIFSAIYVLTLRFLKADHIKIITEHNGWIGPEARIKGMNPFIVWIGGVLQRYSALKSDMIRAVSEGIKSYLISLGANDSSIFIIGNGTDIKHFRPLGITPVYEVGFIGNLVKWQGLDILVDAFYLVTREKPGIRMAIAGSGPEGKNITKRLKALGIEDHVDMLGDIPYKDAPDVINSYKICMAPKIVFSSKEYPHVFYSYSPLKIRDYAACGKPIIASRIRGLEEIEEAGFGLLVPPGNARPMADAILRLIDNPSLCEIMGRKARTYAEKNYSWDIVAMRISENISREP